MKSLRGSASSEWSDPLDPGSLLVDLEYGYDALGNRLWKQDHLRPDHGELYRYDQRNRLKYFARGTLNLANPQSPQISSPLMDTRLPSVQDWTDGLGQSGHGDTELDRRGNWLTFNTVLNGSTNTQTRTLDTQGGAANEYHRVDSLIGNKRVLQQVWYDEAGNLVRNRLVGDMNCDGVANFSDLSAFIFARGLTGTPEERAAAFAAVYPNCPYEMGDVNGDGIVDIADQSGFIAPIQGTTAPVYDYAYDEENRLVAVTTIQGCPVLKIEYDALGRRVATRDHGGDPDPCDAQVVMVYTRHILAGFTPVVEFETDDYTGGAVPGAVAFELAREFLWGPRFPEPLALIDHTDAGDVPAGTPEVLHYLHDALGSVVALTDAGDPDHLDGQGQPDPIAPKVVERYDYDPYGATYVSVWDPGVGSDSATDIFAVVVSRCCGWGLRISGGC